MLVGLVSCSGPKLPRPAPAQDLYTSDLFVKSRRFAELTCERWAILSALHGLVMPEQIVEPYDVQLAKRPKSWRREWALYTNDQLRRAFPGARFVLLAGREYEAAVQGLDYTAPLGRAGIGQRKKWLKEAIESLEGGHGRDQ